MRKIILLVLITTLAISLTGCKNEVVFHTFTEQENQKLSRMVHINTSDQQANEIINKMLDAMMTQSTIEIEQIRENKLETTYKYDIKNSVMKQELESYQSYQNYNTKKESEVLCSYDGKSPNLYKRCSRTSRQDMLRDLSVRAPT